MLKAGLGIAAVTLMALGSPAVAKPPYRLTLSGGAPRGVWSLIGAGLNNAVAKAFPGSVITYQASGGGGLANIPMVARGQVPLALASDAGISFAWNGQKPFTKKIRNIRVIAQMAGWLPMHLIVRRSFAKKYGIRSFSDIAKKKPPIRIAINRRSNVASMISIAMLKDIGVSIADVKSWGGLVVYQPSPVQANLMLDGRIDMIFNQVPIGHGTIRRVQESVDLTMLTLDPKLAKRVAKQVGVNVFTIPAGAYKWQKHALTSPSQGTILIANASMPDKTAYDLAKAIVEQIGQIQAAHPFLKQLTPKFVASLKTVPYHPGALKYYREHGLIK